MIRKALDWLYLLSGGAAALSLLALLVLVVIQMTARWAGFTVTGLTELAGYCMGATSFFALGYALHRGTHIRVEIVLGSMGEDRRAAEILSVFFATLIGACFAYFAVKTTLVSYLLQEKSQGQDAVAIWIPQLVMSFGTIVLLIALIDRLVRVCTSAIDVTPAADRVTGRF